MQFDLLAIRDLLRWFGGSEFWQRARSFVHIRNNNSAKRIAAALGGVCFFVGFFVCILYNIITIQYNLILLISGVYSCFIICTFFCTDLTKKWVSLLNVQFP